MISLNDVLLAMSNIPVDDPIAEIWGRGLQGGHEIIEYTGTLPISITADGNALLDYRIYGNTVQDGTPTPENPVDVVGCGERTENLFDKNATDTANGYVDGEHLRNNGATNSNSLWAITEYIPITGGNNYTFDYGTTSSSPAICYYDNNKQFIQGIAYGGQNPKTVSIPPSVSYIRLSFIKSYADTIMLVQDNSLPETYVPYGYKLPILSNSVASNIYLGEVATTRRIKKLVLTGEEEFNKNTADSSNYLYYQRRGVLLPNSIEKTPLICNELPVTNEAPVSQIGISSDNIFSVIYLNFGADVMNTQPSGNTVEGLREYLAAQYAAGTPVTIWYVLAEPETGIVNEPLMKIGNYTDTVSMEQAGVSIPTSEGTTVIDYDGTPKPSEMYIKYRR